MMHTTASVAAAPRAQTQSKLTWFGFTRPHAIAFLILVAVICVAPMLFYPLFLMRVLCFALFATAFNLLLGYTGLMSFGHAAYFGMGSYIAGWLAKDMGLTPELSILAAGLFGLTLGAAFGYVAIRRQGLYFAMITLALAQFVYFIALKAPFTGGENGLQQIPRGDLFGFIPLQSQMAGYAFVAGVFLLGFLVIYRIIHSPFGQVMRMIRENEPRALSLGYNTDRYKLIVFIISAGFAGLAGGTKAIAFGLSTLTDVHFMMSGEVVLITLVGGLGTVFGPVFGALTIVAMEYMLAPIGTWVPVVQGLAFMVCVLLFRQGIIGELGRVLKLKL